MPFIVGGSFPEPERNQANITSILAQQSTRPGCNHLQQSGTSFEQETFYVCQGGRDK
jgi:hypothetical protein